jgi:hypothetical protein
MPDFDWEQIQPGPLENRFVESSIGWPAWRKLVENLRTPGAGPSRADCHVALDEFLRGANPAETTAVVAHPLLLRGHLAPADDEVRSLWGVHPPRGRERRQGRDRRVARQIESGLRSQREDCLARP